MMRRLWIEVRAETEESAKPENEWGNQMLGDPMKLAMLTGGRRDGTVVMVLSANRAEVRDEAVDGYSYVD